MAGGAAHHRNHDHTPEPGQRPLPGLRVRARGLVWDVVSVDQAGAQSQLHLRCVSGDLLGLEWDLLYPAEQVEILHTDLRPGAPGSLAAWHLFHAACLLEQQFGPGEFLSIEAGRVQIEPYQLVPLMRALELPRIRLLLADGVGLGKTIEAGLIIVEMIARRQAHRVLVVAPSGPLLSQWQQEMRQRFGLRFVAVADRASHLRLQRDVELGGNPFDSVALCLVSLDFAKQERVLEEIERSTWDLAIIDEAHHCIGATATGDQEDTLRRRLAETIAQRSDGLLLLTATPHDGYDPHFASLIELLDPSLVDGHGGLVGSAYRKHVVRRLKSHIRDPTTGKPMFRERRVIPVSVAMDQPIHAASRDFHRALSDLVAPRLRRAMRKRDYNDALAFVSLLKRSVSTIAACVGTLLVVAERYRDIDVDQAAATALRRERSRTLRHYRRRALRFGTLDAVDEDDAARLEAEEIAADLACFGGDEPARDRPDPPDETGAALAALIRLGEVAAAHDPKLDAALREVRLIRAAFPLTNILLYTEYADSQLAALHALRGARDIAGEVLTISGLDSEPHRARVAARCAEQDGLVLISTDSMAEGLNLQHRCFHLIHLDLPYNPNRLEQRNGRIDRYGQLHEPRIRYLYLAGTFEERLLLRLIAKYEKARARLDWMPETLAVTTDEATWSQALVAGFAERQADLFPVEPSAIRTLDQIGEAADAAAYRELLHEIDRAFEGYERTAARYGWLVDRGSDIGGEQLAVAAGLRRRSDELLGHLDLLAFVTAAIEIETGGNPCEPGLLRIPSDWRPALLGLPGFSESEGVLRVTRDIAQWHDAQQHAVAYLGRVHPLVQRAIARVRRIDVAAADGMHDSRVSAAVAEQGTEPSLLLTYSIELRSVQRVELQRLIAVLVSVSGWVRALTHAADWLQFAEPDRAIEGRGLWSSTFAAWAPRRQSDAEAVARAVMQRIALEFAAAHRLRMTAAIEALDRWIAERADDIAGKPPPAMGDLFDPDLDAARLVSPPAPCDRLAAYALDDRNPVAQRRQANTVVTLYQRRSQAYRERTALAAPVLRPLGMLMLVPPGFVC